MASRVVTVATKALRELMGSSPAWGQAQECVLDDIFGFADAAEHPVGDRESVWAQVAVDLIQIASHR